MRIFSQMCRLVTSLDMYVYGARVTDWLNQNWNFGYEMVRLAKKQK